MKFDHLEISTAEGLVFGQAPHSLRTRQGLDIGGGLVYPELNFTLPTMDLNEHTLKTVREIYRSAVREALERAAVLEAPGVVVEFETLPPMVEHPQWGIELAQILLAEMETVHANTGLPSVLRMTPNDLREMERPPLMRSGALLDNMLTCFEGCAAIGTEWLSIESVGGKEVHDDALMACDLPAVLFALTVLGVRDMRYLWSELQKIADRHQVICAGDTACGFGNTAMVLAEKKYIPKVFASVVRAISAVRSLVAYECGAVGPGKDCGYENVYLKAITGYPMAMEGKTAACAHLSPVGNIAAALCDTWSNESVQHIKLLAGMTSTVYLEQLVYDCRLMNTATAQGADTARSLRDLFIVSDSSLDPQAFILSPSAVISIAESIVQSENHYAAGCAAARTAIRLMRQASQDGLLKLSERELPWLDMMEDALDKLPRDEDHFIERMLGEVDTARFHLREYGL